MILRHISQDQKVAKSQKYEIRNITPSNNERILEKSR